MQFSRDFLLFAALVATSIDASLFAQSASASHPIARQDFIIALHESNRESIVSEIGGAFMFPAKCDEDGNLYVRKYATDRPLISPIVKIDAEGKRTALFDPASVSQLKLDRADAFTPALDGGLYQIAAVGIAHPENYVLHFSSDGAASSPIRLDANFRPYQFAAFADGNFLVSGFRSDPGDKSATVRAYTGVFSADGRLLSQLSFDRPRTSRHTSIKPAMEGPPTTLALDLSDAESGADGNIYALRRSSPALIYVISSAGAILRTLTIKSPAPESMPNTFHVSSNQIAVSFSNDTSAQQTLVIADAQSGRRIAAYSDPGNLGQSFACYSADEGAFTFLHLGESNALEAIRAATH